VGELPQGRRLAGMAQRAPPEAGVKEQCRELWEPFLIAAENCPYVAMIAPVIHFAKYVGGVLKDHRWYPSVATYGIMIDFTEYTRVEDIVEDLLDAFATAKWRGREIGPEDLRAIERYKDALRDIVELEVETAIARWIRNLEDIVSRATGEEVTFYSEKYEYAVQPVKYLYMEVKGFPLERDSDDIAEAVTCNVYDLKAILDYLKCQFGDLVDMSREPDVCKAVDRMAEKLPEDVRRVAESVRHSYVSYEGGMEKVDIYTCIFSRLAEQKLAIIDYEYVVYTSFTDVEG